MKKRITLLSAAASCLFAAVFVISGTSLHAEFKFKEFKNDREKFERYAEEAEKSTTEQDWQDILDTGKQEMLADWERSAESEKERYLRQGFSGDEVRFSFEEARAGWENDYEKAESGAKGSWYLKRENLVFENIDFSQLKQSVANAGKDSSVKDVPSWDNFVSSSLADVNSSWDIKFALPLGNLRNKGDLLTGEVKAGFEAELAVFENGLREKFETERNSILYSARNIFITELYVDTESLKYQSGRESADSATDNIIKDVQDDLKSREDKILTKSYNDEGQASIDFSGMGDNWENELKLLVNTGMEKWNSALERLYQQMLNWKQSAEDAYNTAEEIWRKSAEKLENARLEWETKLSKEIYEAFDKWEREEAELAANIEMARTDFTDYMDNLSNQWNDHSSGLIDMAVNGSMVYTGSLDNIKWLEKMCSENENNTTGAFGKTGDQKDQNPDFSTILEQSEIEKIQSILSSKLNTEGKDTIPRRYIDKVCVDSNDGGCLKYSYVPVSYTAHKTGKMIYQNCESNGDNSSDYSCTDNRMNTYLGHYYFTGEGFYKYEYAGATEKQDSSGNWYVTEAYTVRVYGKKMTYEARGEMVKGLFGKYYMSNERDYNWYASNELLETFTITNDVTKDSPDNQKSSYYYYKTELERWKGIRDSFAGIAKDAEVYMHEKNMLGEDGPGYLDNAGGSDPYLMTDAEFRLELASRDRDFWQKRLDIAKAVFDYAEKTKKEDAGTTEINKSDAEEKMNTAKALYGKNLADVKTIVENLKILQGKKPSEERNALNGSEWDAYLTSIEYLTNKYSEANSALQVADKDYTARKRALILAENGENGDYVLKEIQEIERNILQADRDLYLKQVELYKKQMNGEYSERTAGFAIIYESAVKNLEESKLRLNDLKNMISGEESDTSLAQWGNSIASGKNKIWEENSDAYGNVLQNLLDEFNAAAGEEKNLKRDKLSAYIKNIYFDLLGRVESNALIVSTLHDSNFDPDLFFKNGYTEDHSAYENYAETSVKALEIVENAFEWGEDNNSKNYSSILAWLGTEFKNEKFIYGADNSRYIEHYTALKYFENNYHGLTAEAWESSRDRLDSDINFSEKAAGLHNDFNTLNASDLAELISENETKASLGDMDAVALLREYYMTGNGIAGLEYITESDRSAELGRNSYEILRSYISENYRYFQKGQNLLAEHSYLDDMLGYINSIVSLAPGGGDNPLSAEAFKNLTPGNLSIAAGAIADYMEKLELGNTPVPDFLKSAASSIAQIKEKLDSGLFIWRYMTNELSGEMAGSTDDVYSRKFAAFSESTSVMAFIQNCEDIIESGLSDDYTITANILSSYDRLSDSNKKYIADHEDDSVKEVYTFVQNLSLFRAAVDFNNIAAKYELTDAAVTPEQYAAISGLTGDDLTKLVKVVKPVYERRIFNRDYAEGKITDIENYISGRSLDVDAENELRAYALINEYLTRSSGNTLTSTDPAFSDYIKYKKFENYIITLLRESGESDEAYAERCSFSYRGLNGGDTEELNDFAESFINKKLTAFSYLRDDVKIFAASTYYYNEMFSKNKIPIEGIEKFLEDKFGEDSINGSIVDAVTTYSGRLNAISFFYGNDPGKYTAEMDPAVKDYFVMYINGVSEAILPGFEYGLYQSNVTNTAVSVESGKLKGELDKYMSGFDDLAKKMDRYCDIADAGLKNAEALQAFYLNGTQEKNWRGSVMAIEEGDVLVTPLPSDDITGWYDTFDSASGLRNTIIYNNIPVTRDGKAFLLNGIIDDMNEITSIFTALGESMEPGTKYDSSKGITGFLKDADMIYTSDSNYIFENGKFSYETGLGSIVSGYETLRDSNDSAIASILREIEGIDAGISNSRNLLQSKKFSYDLLGGKEIKDLMSELEVSRTAHETAKREVDKFRDSLAEARENYEKANTAYIDKMNEVSAAYSSYKTFEFNYEKAYSVWEYANTPYLKENKTDEGNITDGQTPAGGSADYGDIPVPDAKDNYAGILAKYNEINAEYIIKAKAVENQDTIEKLNADAEYKKLKENFERKSESYIRTAQVDAEVKEDLEKYKQQYSLSQKAYESAKDSISFYMTKMNVTSLADQAAFEKLRDTILNHMLKAGNEAESKAVLGQYMNALSWYSCKVSTISHRAERERLINLHNYIYYEEIENLTHRISSNASSEAAFNSLSVEMKNDIISIYNNFNSGEDNDNLQKILNNYHQQIYWYDMYKEADDKYHSISKWNPVGRRRWKNKRNDREAKYNNYKRNYHGAISPVTASLENARKTKIDYAAKAETLEGVSSVRYLDDIKAYLKQGKYSLSDEDLSHLYDSSSEGYTPDSESINLDFLRVDVERKDLDGETVYAAVNGDTITVLDKDGKPQFKAGKPVEVYNIDDPSIRVEERDGKYVVIDRNYSISAVTGVLKERAAGIRQNYYAALMSYVDKSVTEEKHDNTVVLRDMENTFHGLQEFAETFNLTADPDGEKRQRGFEGYGTITREYVNNVNGESLQGLIMTALMRQSSELQRQLWTQQQEKFQERKKRWNEVTGYILNRGMKEWRENYGEFKNLWTKWRFDAKKMIAEGEEWWTGVNSSISQNMKTWAADTSRASSKEAAHRIYNDLEGQISKYETDLKKKMPDSPDFEPDTDKILSQAIKSRPLDSIGILSQSMLNIDTTAGFTNLLNLGLNGSLSRYNEEQMDEYTDAIGVLKNLQIIDILNSIIDGFNKQLIEANQSVYEGVEYNIRGNETFGLAPFERKSDENRWEIEVCTASNLTGDKYKTRRFADYSYFINSTVFFQPIKGPGGTAIDFTQANTYSKLDGEELDTYVGLESEWLSRKIEDVFREGGTFSGHQQDEYNRLYGKFGDYYGEWMAGEALRDGAFYSKPMFPNGPNMMTAAAMAATFSGNPWLAVAINAASTSLQVADGSLAWKHAGVQMGIGAASTLSGGFSPLVTMASSGIKYEEGGGIGWSNKQFKQGVKSGVIRMGVQMAMAQAGEGSVAGQIFSSAGTAVVMSGMKTDGGWGHIGFDTSNWSQHLTAGVAASVTAALSISAGGENGTARGFEGNDALSQMVEQGILTAAYNMRGGKGFKEDYSKYNWNAMAPSAEKLGSMLGGMASDFLESKKDEYDKRHDPGRAPVDGGDPLGTIDNILSAMWYGLDKSKKYAKSIISDIGKYAGGVMDDLGLTGAVNTVVSTAANAYNTAKNFVKTVTNFTGGMFSSLDSGVRGFAERTGNLFTEGEFATDEQLEQIKEQQRLEEILRNQNLKENQKLVDAKYGESYTKAVPETDNSKAVHIIKDKLANGQDVSEAELKAFFDSAHQQSKGNTTLEKELMETIKNDPKAFEEAMKSKKLDPNKPEDVQKFSRQMQAGFCVLFSEYAQMTLNNVNGTAPSIGEFYKDLLNGKSSNGGKLINVLSQNVSTQEIFDSVAGKGNVKVVGYGQDRDGHGFEDEAGKDTKDYSSSDMMKKLKELAGDKSINIKYFTLRMSTGDGHFHDVTLRNEKGNLRLYDNSRRGVNKNYSDYIKLKDIKSFYYIR
ncbi:MAG TPA: hypothetical protein PLY36_06585 [Spirochaetota bacterium]|nr:hypothetical protein [Spirochaetota bacterium]